MATQLEEQKVAERMAAALRLAKEAWGRAGVPGTVAPAEAIAVLAVKIFDCLGPPRSN